MNTTNQKLYKLYKNLKDSNTEMIYAGVHYQNKSVLWIADMETVLIEDTETGMIETLNNIDKISHKYVLKAIRKGDRYE